MKRTAFLFVFAAICAIPAWSQPVKLLNAEQLREAKEYTSIEEALEHPEKVFKLNLKAQKIKKLDPRINEFANLQVLNLMDNRIKVLPPEIGGLANLQWLSLYGNKLRSVPEQMRSFQNLSTLFLGKNRLTELPVWIGGYKKLRSLDLFGNKITEREYESIKNRLPNCKVTI